MVLLQGSPFTEIGSPNESHPQRPNSAGHFLPLFLLTQIFS
jgi:hypothetical protein